MCDKKFTTGDSFEDHLLSHTPEENSTEYKCLKCNKVYNDMRKLRRHDWRNHRSIECTMCQQTLDSRQDIVSHRQTKHKMYRKLSCRYFPDCYDGEECLFEHDIKGNVSSLCPNGEKCSDQTCTFNEQQHRCAIQSLCKFQAQCNIFGCQYKHNVARRAFLGEGPSERRRT